MAVQQLPDFQALRESLGLSGHYQRQVEGFYWEQRRSVCRIKTLRPDLTVAEAQAFVQEGLGDVKKPWQGPMLHILLADTALVDAAFEDFAQKPRRRTL